MRPGPLAALLEIPIVRSPLAGGPSTPALAAAVCEAGGLGFLAAGYRSAAALSSEIGDVRRRTPRPFGVNLFVPARLTVDEDAVAAYAASLTGEAERYGVELGAPTWSDDDWDAKLAVVLRERPPVVSFTFGCPDREVVSSLQTEDVAVW
jgi:nitronate monooxygenase